MATSTNRYTPGGFGIDPMATTGLFLRVMGGILLDSALGMVNVANAHLALPASSTNYVEVDSAGAMTTNTTGFTSGRTYLYVVTTGATQVTDIKDWRASHQSDPLVGIGTTLGNASTVGGIPRVIKLAIADSSADTDITVVPKIQVLDFWFQATGIAGHATADTIQLKNSATAITDAIAKTATVNKIVRCSTIDPAQATISAGGTLRFTAVHNTNVAGVGYVLAVLVP